MNARRLVGVANNQTSVLHPEPKFGTSDCRPVPSVRFAPLLGARPITASSLIVLTFVIALSCLLR